MSAATPRRLVVAVVLAVATGAFAKPPPAPGLTPERGALTGAGIVLAGVSVLSLGLVAHEELVLADSNRRLNGYLPSPRSAPSAANAPIVSLLERRREGAQAWVLPFALVSAAAALAGVVCIALDGSGPVHPAVAFAPGGASFGLAGTF